MKLPNKGIFPFKKLYRDSRLEVIDTQHSPRVEEDVVFF